MNNKPSPVSIVFIVLLLAALVGGVMLAGQNQNQQRGAYFSGASLKVLPVDASSVVGGVFSAQVWVTTQNNAKINTVDTTVCYGDGVVVDETDADNHIILNKEAFKVLQYSNNDKTAKCLRFMAASIGLANDALKSGPVKVATIRFKAIKIGNGKLDIKSANTVLGGYNPAGNSDSGISVSSVESANYHIMSSEITPTPTTPAGTCGWCGASCIKKFPDTVCTEQMPPTGKSCITNASNACEIVDTVAPSLTPTLTPVPPTATPTGGLTTLDPYLKFKISLLKVRHDFKCREADKLPLVVTVRSADGTSKTYPGIIPVKDDTALSDGTASYSVKLKLTGFNSANNVAVFVKSPKSLQVKYGKNNQTEYYGVAGGELDGLTANEASTPVFNFSGYPLLAGDVTGPDDVQDGSVDGLDFSYVKKESNKRTGVSDGEYMLADLNGNCQMESGDLAALMISLSVKQGQLY